MTIDDFVLLSDNAERVLYKLISKPSPNLVFFTSTDADFNFDRNIVCKELIDGNYISNYNPIGQSRTRRFSCSLDIRASQYFKIKPTYQYREAKKMFVKLTGEARDLLLNMVENKDDVDSYIASVSNEPEDPKLKKILDYLQGRDFLTYEIYIDGTFDVTLKYSAEHYFDLEKEFLEEQSIHQQIVNVTAENAIIQTGNNNFASITNNNELSNIVESIRGLLPKELPDEDKELIIDNAEAIKEEIQKGNPKKGFIKAAISGLQSSLPKIAGAIELTAAITDIIQFASTFL